MIAPRGILAPSFEYLAGFLRKLTISVSSCLEPSQPATSSKVTPVAGSIWIFDLDLPMPIGPPGPPRPPMPPPAPPLRCCKKKRPPMMISGKASAGSTPSRPAAAPFSAGGCTANTTFFFVSSLMSSADSPGRMRASCRLPSLSMASACLPSAEKETFSMRSESIASTEHTRDARAGRVSR